MRNTRQRIYYRQPSRSLASPKPGEPGLLSCFCFLGQNIAKRDVAPGSFSFLPASLAGGPQSSVFTSRQRGADPVQICSDGGLCRFVLASSSEFTCPVWSLSEWQRTEEGTVTPTASARRCRSRGVQNTCRKEEEEEGLAAAYALLQVQVPAGLALSAATPHKSPEVRQRGV